MASRELNRDVELPHSLEAERAVLGAILSDRGGVYQVDDVLKPEHFFLDAHQKIFAAILNLTANNDVPDIVTVAEKLRELGGQNDYLTPQYMADLVVGCPITQNISHYAEIVRRYYYLRRIIRACSDTIKSAQSYEGGVEGFVEGIEKEFLAIAGENDRSGIVAADKVLEKTIEEIQARLERDGSLHGVPTGFKKLDGMTGGLQGSDLIILAARPGMGKTALALNIATYAATKGKSVVIFTLEMSKEQLMQRILSSVARVDSSRLRKGDLNDEEQDFLMEGARRIFECRSNLGIDETPGITLTELRSRCRRYHKEFGLDLIVIDYLQLMGSASHKKYDSREREISEISMGLKELAKELKVPVVALAQLNRGPDARPDKKPKLSDLRESGSMEQDADMILFVYRDEYYNKDSELAGIAEVIVGKNRHGSLDTIKLAFQPSFVKFENLFEDGDLP